MGRTGSPHTWHPVYLFGVVHVLYPILKALQPLLIPLCFVTAWGVLILLAWNLWAFFRDSVNQAQQMHQIPCANCRYFTGDYHLKCTVHPGRALSEEAIDCQDFEAGQPYARVLTASHSRNP